jgi:hypothetical protein
MILTHAKRVHSCGHAAIPSNGSPPMTRCESTTLITAVKTPLPRSLRIKRGAPTVCSPANSGGSCKGARYPRVADPRLRRTLIVTHMSLQCPHRSRARRGCRAAEGPGSFRISDWHRHAGGQDIQDIHRFVLEVRLLLIAGFECGLLLLPAPLLRHYEF